MNKSNIFIDFETTGVNPDQDQVIQMSALKVENGNRFLFNKYLVPTVPIHPMASKANGLTLEMLKKIGSKSTILAWAEFFDFISYGDKIIGHNIIAFDNKFAAKAASTHHLLSPILDHKIIDTAMICKGKNLGIYQQEWESHVDYCARVHSIRAWGVKYNLAYECFKRKIDTTRFHLHSSEQDVRVNELLYNCLVNEGLII